MKVGLYVIDMPATLGGGYVLRDDVARAALAFKGTHQFELVQAGRVAAAPAPEVGTPPRRSLRQLLRQASPIAPPPADSLDAELRRRGIDLLWFNHVEPVHVGIPYILNIFDLQHRLQPWFPEVSNDGQWEHREQAWADAVRRAAIVTVGSEEAKAQLSHFYGVPLDNIRPVPFPTPRGAIEAAARPADPSEVDRLRQKYGFQGEFLYYPAQFWPHKNHVNLLHALRILHDEHHMPLSLVLTGADHGNLTHVKEVAERLDLASFVHYLGFVPHEDVLALYRGAFALSYVSFFGPENLPPLEALALECPVVLSDIPGVRALFGEAPVLVDPRSDRSIADGIRSLRDHPERRCAHARAGRDLAIANSHDAYVRAVHELVDEFASIRRCWP